jgi:hypothetical protein
MGKNRQPLLTLWPSFFLALTIVDFQWAASRFGRVRYTRAVLLTGFGAPIGVEWVNV